MTKAFDTVAKSYDNDFSNSNIGKVQRRQVWKHLDGLLSPSSKVLEISCGTGVDAVHMSPKVQSVLATDISTAMINEAELKKTSHQLNNCRFACVDAVALDALPERDFDLVFSNFGGLNCLSPQQLQKFSQHAFEKLKPGGYLCLVFISKKCFWERIYFAIRHTHNKGRRLRAGGSHTSIGGIDFLTHYYSVEELKQTFKPFQFLTAAPIGLFVPPGFLEKKIPKAVLSILNGLDTLFSRAQVTADFWRSRSCSLSKKLIHYQFVCAILLSFICRNI